MKHNKVFKTFLDTISEHKLIKDGDTVLIALSGGADSAVMFDMLIRLKEKMSVTVEAAHINHMFRPTALRDEEFCRSLCERHNVTLHVRRIDVLALSKKLGIGFEECGRKVRYEVFDEIMKERAITSCATAHNRDDNAETIILNFVRGASLRGLSGIPYRRGSIIRPILDIKKADILNYASENKIDFVTDETNTDTSYTRNFIRHELIPKIERINPSFSDTVSKNASGYLRDDIYLTSLAQNILRDADIYSSYIKMPVSKLSSLDEAILSRVVYLACERISKKTPDFYAIERAMRAIYNGQGNFEETLFGDVSLEISYGFAYFVRHMPPKNYETELDLEKGFEIFEEAGIKIEYKVTQYSKKSSKDYGFIYLDYDIMNGRIFFAPRREGDTIRPFGGSGTRSIKRFMQDQKIPKFLRPHLPLLRCGNDVVWASPVKRIHEKYAAGENTQNILCIRISKLMYDKKE